MQKSSFIVAVFQKIKFFKCFEETERKGRQAKGFKQVHKGMHKITQRIPEEAQFTSAQTE